VTKIIVVPLDGSSEAQRSVPIAKALAGECDAELVLVGVSSLVERTRLDLERVDRGLALDARIAAVDGDDVVAAICDVVAQENDPSICMTTHARGRVGHALLGSVAEGLLRTASAPFVLVGPHCRATWPPGGPRMLACLDESETSNAILSPVVEWASSLGMELWLTEVFHPLDVPSAEAPNRFLDAIVERLRPELPGVKACAAWSSHPAGEILRLADSLAASLIAMGTHGRRGMARVALGSVTMEVVHRARCPVLTIRPDLIITD
jgi:nucleotide-binding universal stress UspA family protein